jgi:hypothetical protein
MPNLQFTHTEYTDLQQKVYLLCCSHAIRNYLLFANDLSAESQDTQILLTTNAANCYVVY